ncbi:CoA transferase [Mycobacterium sp. E796]|uniref:CoA transferase n=1 Tax=Mycobacterium sp. E796 TaxID=1834151 RepID=UPI000802472E|nr:CoA transferase [Mycobacterium sp. E796]OBI40864.1 acyl-CoA transferase [Mycobacterium sp. E796]
MAEGLLETVRVLDLSGGSADAVTRLFADLGADVLKIEFPGGSLGRDDLPALAGASIPFALHNANKRAAVLDPLEDNDCGRFLDLAAEADIVVDSGLAGHVGAFGISGAELAARYPHLVVLSVTDFGETGPRSAWRATDPVLFAMCGSLARSGPTTGTPVLPPDGIASATAAVQAAWAALVAYYNRLRCGTGDYIDFSRFDAVVMALDPAFGAHGQVAAGTRHSGQWRGRPKNQDAYPICPCKDGYVRLCVMAPRQWRGLRRWLGEPDEFQDPKYDAIGARMAAWPEISVLAQALFADQTMKDLVAAGQAHGVPIAAVLPPSWVLGSEHFQEVGAITEAELLPRVRTSVPTGYFVVDRQRAGFRTPAPAMGQDEPYWRGNPVLVRAPSGRVGDYPLSGLRILDLGIIVAGGELSRLFSDLGAEVIKVESSDYPDGLRQARAGDAMSESFAWTHRNQLGLGLDLRSAEGKAIFRRLVAEADAVFANFKPGTLASLGFDYDALRAINPRIVLAGSSAYGDSGPWRTRLGYGPLVRAATGVTRLWTSEDADDRADVQADTGRHAFYDATTIFPDHVVGRVSAIAALAALIRRDRTGGGAHVHVSQAEVVINQLDTLYVTEAALAAGIGPIRHDTSLHAVYPCAGDDEWCVISIGTDDEWRCLAGLLDHPQWVDDPRFGTGESRLAHRHELIDLVSAWTRTRTPLRNAELLQAAGVPAGPMNRPPDILEDPQLTGRKLFSDMTHPLIERPMPAETGPAPFQHIPPAPQRPAPLPGQDTREICRNLLGMNADETERLIRDGVLFATAD